MPRLPPVLISPQARWRARLLPGRNLLGRHLLPIAFELFGDQLGKSGQRALTHFRSCDAHHASIVRLDRNPNIDLGAVIGCGGFRPEAEREMQSECEPAACRRRKRR